MEQVTDEAVDTGVTLATTGYKSTRLTKLRFVPFLKKNFILLSFNINIEWKV
jgi:hypothetical protein